MPVVHHVMLASGAVVAVSVAVAAAMAMYENPELRRYAEDVRRRIAMAISSLGDSFNQPEGTPRFNRPEDAEGFLQSRRGAGAEQGVDADEATRRRQRDELMYWNMKRFEMEEANRAANQTAAQPQAASPTRPSAGPRGRSFDDFMKQDEQGLWIFNSSADTQTNTAGLRNRSGRPAPFENPFADEYYCSDSHELAPVLWPRPDLDILARPPQEDCVSDIYSATTREDDDTPFPERRVRRPPVQLIDIPSGDFDASGSAEDLDEFTAYPLTAQDDLQGAHVLTAQDIQASVEQIPSGPQDIQRWSREAFASASQSVQESARAFEASVQDDLAKIEARTRDSSHTVSLPPSDDESESVLVPQPEGASEGQMTPTDSASIIGWSEVESVANDVSEQWATCRHVDAMSDGEGMLTPASWSEIDSVASEHESNV